MYVLQIALVAALLAATLAFGPEALTLARTSGSYPLVVLSSLAVLLAATLASLLARRRRFATGSEIGTLGAGGIDRHLRLALVVAVWIGWAAAVPFVGFIAATAAAMFASIALAGMKGPVRIAVGSVLFAVLLTVAVKTVLYVAVPEAAPEAYLERLLFRLRN